MHRSLHRSAAPTRPHRLAPGLWVTVALWAAALALSTASAPAATVPQGMFGMNDWSLPSEGTMAKVRGAGVRRWRAGMFWHYVESSRGERNWSFYDDLASASARQGSSLLMIVGGCPKWACSSVNSPPRTPDALAAQRAFLQAAVSRYGTGGSFWRAHPELPGVPVTEWQVGNEVNHPDYWKPGPSAAEYARFLRDESTVIRSADPGATVVLSGLSDIRPANAEDFLRQLYAQPGFKPSFDVAAVHAYQPDARHVGLLLDRTRRVMRENGDDSPLWVTEIGWGTSSSQLRTPTSAQRQADLMRESFDMMIGCGSRWNLGRAYWFAYRDISASKLGQPDNAGMHTGLFDTSGRAKPAWSTLHDFRAGAARPPGSGAACQADARAPETRIRSRKRFKRVRRARMRFRASERAARFQCQLVRVRGKPGGARAPRAARVRRRWRTCRRNYRTPKLRRGRYRLQVRAVDREGNVDRSPATARLLIKGSRYSTVTVTLHRTAKHRRKHR